jgi:hypothetical protein
MVYSMIAPVFLSASEPDSTRREEYTITANVVNLREAVRAFCAHVLPNFPLVFGGHPAITPFVRTAARRIAYDLEDPELADEARLKKPQVVMFQSRQFVDWPPAEDEAFTDAHDDKGNVVPPKSGSRRLSLLFMRYEMIGSPDPKLDEALRQQPRPHSPSNQAIYQMLRSDADTFGAARKYKLDPKNNGKYAPDGFSAAVFIGGMEGVEREFHIFRSFHPETPALPIGSTGSACRNLLKEVAANLPSRLFEALRDNTAYSLLMQQILPVLAPREGRLSSLAQALNWSAGEPPLFKPEDHADPEDLAK